MNLMNQACDIYVCVFVHYFIVHCEAEYAIAVLQMH